MYYHCEDHGFFMKTPGPQCSSCPRCGLECWGKSEIMLTNKACGRCAMHPPHAWRWNDVDDFWCMGGHVQYTETQDPPEGDNEGVYRVAPPKRHWDSEGKFLGYGTFEEQQEISIEERKPFRLQVKGQPMSDDRDEDAGRIDWGSLNKPEPAPEQNTNKPIFPMVIEDIRERAHEGLKKYGTYLQANNGRKPLIDAYQEALDLTQYLRQAIEEGYVPDDVALRTQEANVEMGDRIKELEAKLAEAQRYANTRIGELTDANFRLQKENHTFQMEKRKARVESDSLRIALARRKNATDAEVRKQAEEIERLRLKSEVEKRSRTGAPWPALDTVVAKGAKLSHPGRVDRLRAALAHAAGFDAEPIANLSDFELIRKVDDERDLSARRLEVSERVRKDLTGSVNRLYDKNVELRNRIKELEGSDSELSHLRTENGRLREKLDTIRSQIED